MIAITQNVAINLECIVLSPLGKPVTGLSIDYEIIDCSDESVLTSGTATEGTGGYYYFTYTFTAIAEYRLHWISPTNYEDGFELLNVVNMPVDVISELNTSPEDVAVRLRNCSTPTDITTSLTAFGVSTLTVAQVWDYLTATILTPGSIGKLLVDNIDTKLSDLPTLFWSKVIDGTYTADKVLKIMASILAGKTVIVDTGNNTAIVTFRNLDNTSDVIKANMNNSERITMTLTP